MQFEPVREASLDVNRYKINRPSKLLSPKGLMSNPSADSAINMTLRPEILSSKNSSPSKKTLNNLITPTHKKGDTSVSLKRTGENVLSPFQKGKSSYSIKDLSSAEADIYTPLKNINFLGKPNEIQKRELKFGYNLSDNREQKLKNANKNTNVEPSDNDWTAINGSDNVDEEMTKVRMLEAWQFEMMKDKVAHTLGNNEITSLSKNQKAVQENHGFPRINAKLIQTILSNNDDETKSRPSAVPSLNSLSQSKNKKKVTFGSDIVQSLENAIRENNQEILYELIQKKIKDFFYKTDIETMTKEQLKVHTRMIAENVTDQFKSLKGTTNVVLIQNRIDYIIGRLKSSKQRQADQTYQILNSVAERKNKFVTDYKTIESAYIRNYQQSLQNIQDLRDRLKSLHKSSYRIHNNLKISLKQLEQFDENAVETTESSGAATTKRQDTYKAEIDMTASIEFPKVVQKTKQELRQERKKALLALQEQIKEQQSELVKVGQQTELTEKELKASRNYKVHYRIQLKDLYFKILKDEVSLVDQNNMISYPWVVRALWRMNEDVKAHNFPNFLDQGSITFFLSYTKLQDQLEKHCKQNNLMFLIASADDFKDNNNNLYIKAEEIDEKTVSPLQLTQNLSNGLSNGDTSAALNEKKGKDFHALLDTFKDKMSSLKKTNLKAKKLVQNTYYNNKGKYTVSKWEDVDPNQAIKEAANQTLTDDEEEHEGMSPTNDEKSTKLFDNSAFKNSEGPLDKALDIMEMLKKRREEETSRIISQYIARDLDEKQKLMMKKIFRFLFTRKEGGKAFFQYISEKLSFDQKNLRQLSVYQQQKNATENEPQSATTKLLSGMGYVENQIWNTNSGKMEFPLVGGDVSSAELRTPTSTINTTTSTMIGGAGDSIFKIAANKILG